MDMGICMKKNEEGMNTEDKAYNAKRSLGFSWKLPDAGLNMSPAEDMRTALFTFHKYRVEHVSKTLRTLEHIPCTFAQTRTILDGKTVSGLSTKQLRSIENYGLACEKLVDMLEKGTFSLSKDTLFSLHEIVAKDEALHVGRFRGHQVLIEQSHYIPPKSEYLESIFEEGVKFLSSLKNTQEKSICSFLFLSRSQFFSDCNKRTANLAMNGLLMQNGFQPLSIDSEHFLEKMAQFYESSDATDVISEIDEIARKQYTNTESQNIEQLAQEKIKEQSAYEFSISAYDAKIKDYAQEKTAQIESLEPRLEQLVQNQQMAVLKIQEQRPGPIASLWKGAAWKQEQQTRQARLETLECRLSRVKKLRQDGKCLEDFAIKKLRRNEPELTAKRDELLQKQRREAVAAQVKRQEQMREQGQSLGLSRVREIEL